ncbi:MAG TPA: hypothetical protein VF954_08325 [Acidimicrobiales bacterium]
MRPVLAVVAAAAAAAIGALVLGEYSMSGLTPVVAGLLFGFGVAEVLLAAAPRPFPGPAPWTVAAWAAAAAVLTDAGLGWAAWIQLRHRHQGVPGGVWLALAIGAAAGAAWVRSSGRRGARSRPTP